MPTPRSRTHPSSSWPTGSSCRTSCGKRAWRGFELRQLLRQQGHGAFEGLRAVVLEPTGSISVVPAGAPISEEFLTEVAGGHRLEVD